MELALSLGDASKPFKFLDKATSNKLSSSKDLEFCMGLGTAAAAAAGLRPSQEKVASRSREGAHCPGDKRRLSSSSSDPPPLQLDLLPFSPVPRTKPSSQIRLPWLTPKCSADGPGKGFDVNCKLSAEETTEDGASLSSPNSTGGVSSLQMDFGIRNGGQGKKRDMELVEAERAGSRASDDEENGSARKKLRLSKEQSAFLEESFKEHSSLNPKQKLALAKQLNLRPRQVEVWFQNRRARTKLKQTEVDCEYLKRCCETLTEENRRLQKELQELRALKTSQPFYMQLPATTLTMCPSCERVASTTPAATVTTTTSSSGTTGGKTTTTITNAVSSSTPAVPTALSLARPSTGMYPFSHAQQVHKPTAQARQAA